MNIVQKGVIIILRLVKTKNVLTVSMVITGASYFCRLVFDLILLQGENRQG